MALPNLSAEQVTALYDGLLFNADTLVADAQLLLDAGSAARARSLAILGLEESGKAIALHERRFEMAYEDEGTDFTNSNLRKIWTSHKDKLTLVHQFIVNEDYWFGDGPPDRHELLLGPADQYLETLKQWASEDNTNKMRGFYVDVDQDSGDLMVPADIVKVEIDRAIEMTHQVGWQIRLGDHIRAKQLFQIHAIARPRRAINNRAYIPKYGVESGPLENVGKRGYEAESRELLELHARLFGSVPGQDPAS